MKCKEIAEVVQSQGTADRIQKYGAKISLSVRKGVQVRKRIEVENISPWKVRLQSGQHRGRRLPSNKIYLTGSSNYQKFSLRTLLWRTRRLGELMTRNLNETCWDQEALLNELGESDDVCMGSRPNRIDILFFLSVTLSNYDSLSFDYYFNL